MSLTSHRSLLTRATVMALAVGFPLLVPPAAFTQAHGHCSATTTQAYLDCMADRTNTSSTVARGHRVDGCNATDERNSERR